MLGGQRLELHGLDGIVGVNIDADHAATDDAEIVARVAVARKHLAEPLQVRWFRILPPPDYRPLPSVGVTVNPFSTTRWRTR